MRNTKTCTLLLVSSMPPILLLTACSDKAREVEFSAMPKELADCRVYKVTNNAGDSMTVVRCPNSATTAVVKSGKSSETTATIDGVEYMMVPKAPK